MDFQDLKIYALNGVSLAISFSNVEMILKIILLLLSIGYTISKWYEVHNRNK
jgi:hypothetical protein